jgi:hypothetical protein
MAYLDKLEVQLFFNSMFKQRIRQVAFLALLGLTLGACEQQEVTPAKSLATATTANEEADYSDLAQVVASALAASPNARALVKEMALTQFDGDYDVLYRDLADQKLQSGGSFADLLAEHYVQVLAGRGQDVTTEAAREWLTKQTSSIAWCQLAVPTGCLDWDTEQFAPKVVALPADFDDQTTESVVSYQGAELKATPLLVKEELAEPIVVIGPSERVDAQGQPRYTVESEQALVNNKGFLNRYQLRNLSSIESFLLGRPELRLVTYKIISPCYTCQPMSQPYTGLISDARWAPSVNDVKNGRWDVVNRYLYTWDSAYMGTWHRDYWLEQDGGGGRQQTEEIPFAKGMKAYITLYYQANDDLMGSANVLQSDSPQLMYSTGLVNWLRGQ